MTIDFSLIARNVVFFSVEQCTCLLQYYFSSVYNNNNNHRSKSMWLSFLILFEILNAFSKQLGSHSKVWMQACLTMDTKYFQKKSTRCEDVSGKNVYYIASITG